MWYTSVNTNDYKITKIKINTIFLLSLKKQKQKTARHLRRKKNAPKLKQTRRNVFLSVFFPLNKRHGNNKKKLHKQNNNNTCFKTTPLTVAWTDDTR